MLRPSPNHGTQWLPNDDDDDDQAFILHFHKAPPLSLSFCPSVSLSVFLISGLPCGLEMLICLLAVQSSSHT